MPQSNDGFNQFGGAWTVEKLEILREYLDGYSTALKNQPFKLWYIDAFAGTGEVEVRVPDPEQQEVREFLQGSASIARDIDNKPFDQLVFIESDKNKADRLKQLEPESGRIQVRAGDANNELPHLCRITDWKNTRAVVFLDPFSLQTAWKTIEILAKTKAIDVWILFPVSAVSRLMAKKEMPEGKLAEILDVVFGDESWQKIYHDPLQKDLFDESTLEREKGIDQIIELYKKKLETLFAGVAPTSRSLKNSKNATLFEMIFAVSNENAKAKRLAIGIADHILQKM